MKHPHHIPTAEKAPLINQPEMNHATMQHGANPAMGMAGHNHHAMMMPILTSGFM